MTIAVETVSEKVVETLAPSPPSEVKAKEVVEKSAKVEIKPPPKAPEKVRTEGEEDDEEGEDKTLTLTPEQLRRRIARGEKAFLRSQFGTDDPATLKAKIAKAEALEKAEEERRRKALDVQQRLEEDLAKEKAARTAAEAKAESLAVDRSIRESEQYLAKVAEGIVNPKYVHFAWDDLRKWMKKEYNEEIIAKDGVPDEDLKKWFETYIVDKPELAAKKSKEDEVEKPVKKTALVTGSKREDRPTPVASGNAQVKTFRIGQANSMTAEEAKEAARARGIRWG